MAAARGGRKTGPVTISFPAPLRPGDLIGVTSPSSGVAPPLSARLDFAVSTVRARGYEVLVGDCMDGSAHVSAPAELRAAELTRMLTDPAVRAVIPPWGGETAIDLLPLLDWEAIAAAEPTWFIGSSDNSVISVPLLLRAGLASVHGINLMDTPYVVPDGLLSWLDIVTRPAGSSFTQISPGIFRDGSTGDWARHPALTEIDYNGTGSWVRLDSDRPAEMTGRLIGGCTEIIRHLAGTAFADLGSLTAMHPADGLIIYLEAAQDDAYSICRSLHGLRLAGFFDAAAAVLIGRTSAPDGGTLTQHEAVLDALGGLGIPLIADVECGHVPPFMPMVNGALGRVRYGGGRAELSQQLA
jgi:muramoyltetrapeptide carboxypeptidase